MLSYAKLEKVVKPPNIPIIKKNFMLSEIFAFAKNPISKPISKEPKRLTRKVPVGKPVLELLKKLAIRCLPTAPIAPPKAIYKIFTTVNNLDYKMWCQKQCNKLIAHVVLCSLIL